MAPLTRSALQSVAATAFALALVLALPPASAQVLDPAITLVILDAPAPIGPGNSTMLNGTVSNDNQQVAATVTLTFQAPEGWTVVVEPDSAFQLAGGAQETFTVTISAPAEAVPTNGDLTLTATTAADQAGRTATSAQTVALVFEPLPVIVIPWYQTPGGIAGIALAVALVVGIVVGVTMRNRAKRLAAQKAAAEAAAHAAYMDRETGVTLGVTGEPIQYGHRREVVHRVAVTNASQRPRVAIVDVVEVTNGWRAALQITKVPLSVGETQHVTLVVTPDAVITPGDRATVVVRARPEEARERDERVTVEVAAPKHGVPQDPHYKIVSVHREGAGSPTLRQ